MNLVLFAFEHGQNGDLFVQKSPAATIRVLADALIDLYNADVDVRMIGTGNTTYSTATCGYPNVPYVEINKTFCEGESL